LPGEDTGLCLQTSLLTGTPLWRSPRSGTLTCQLRRILRRDQMATTDDEYQARQKPKLGGVRVSHRHYIHVHIFHFSCRCSHVSIVFFLPVLFSCLLFVCLKNFQKTQKYFLASFCFFFLAFSQFQLREKTKKISLVLLPLVGSFPM
jgi:hypothetical protein